MTTFCTFCDNEAVRVAVDGKDRVTLCETCASAFESGQGRASADLIPIGDLKNFGDTHPECPECHQTSGVNDLGDGAYSCSYCQVLFDVEVEHEREVDAAELFSDQEVVDGVRQVLSGELAEPEIDLPF